MAEESILSDELVRQLISVGEVDILVGIPTFNHAATIADVVRTVQLSVMRQFPRERAVIVNADGGSRDGTPELVRSAELPAAEMPFGRLSLRTFHRVVARYPGEPSPGTALRLILAAADLLRARACAVVLPDGPLAPEAVERLLRPVYSQDYDFVSPLYERHKYDGLLVTNLIYPVVRALYGFQLREPRAERFGLSHRLITTFLERGVWEQEAVRKSPEIWMVTTALAEGYKVCQANLGHKGPPGAARGANVVAAIQDAAGALFWSIKQHESFWAARQGSEPLPILGEPPHVTAEPLRLNRRQMFTMFRTGLTELRPILETILAPETLAGITRAAECGEADFRYPADLWARTVYDFAVARHRDVIHRGHLMQALVPLYRGRAYTFIMETWQATAAEVEEQIESLCLEFERLKPYLLERWQGEK